MKNTSKTLKRGGYSIIVTAIVIAVVVIVNIAVAAVPAVYTKHSTSDLYTISDTSRKIIGELSDDVTVYTVVVSEGEDELIDNFVEKYASLSSHIHTKKVDPALHPNFIKDYSDLDLDATLTTLVVENEKTGRSKVICYNDIFYGDYDMSYDEFIYYYHYYGSVLDQYLTSAFSLDSKLTSAIDYVTVGELPTVYVLNGHSEITLDNLVTGLLDDENIKTEALSLKTSGSIPSDASVIIIDSPSLDLEESEITALEGYIQAGGNIILTTDYSSDKLTNLDNFVESYGMKRDRNYIVCEGSASNRGQQYGVPFYHYLFPVIEDNSYSRKLSLDSTSYIMMHSCNSIDFADGTADNITLTSLLTTTEKGYLKGISSESLEKAEGDPEGIYTVAAQAEISLQNEKNAHLVWFTSSDIINGASAQYYANVPYMISVITELCGKDGSVTIGSQSLQIESLTVPEASVNIWGTLLIAVIPIGILLYGGVIWYRRTRR